MIENAQIPVYGVSENAFGLRVRVTRYSQASRGPEGVTLIFAGPDPVSPQVVASFDALRVGIRNLKLPPWYGVRPNADPALRFLTSYRRDLSEQIHMVSPQTITRQIVLPGFELETEILNWPDPINRDSPDQTDFPRYSPLWDGAN
ncbi:MAG: hypothetical protein O2913_13555, partial [Chloroflexi bacterium]|nr:hypothetical protein [Chloroflexota bacterium]